MGNHIDRGTVTLMLALSLAAPVGAVPLEDGEAAYDRGDYSTARYALAAEKPDLSEKTTLEEICRTVLCRQPQPVRLKLENGTPFGSTCGSPSPIVPGSMVTVLAGETVMVEADLKDGRLSNLTAVSSVTHPDRTLVFKSWQDPSLEDGLGMMLKVESPFPGVLEYKLGLMLPADSSLYKTSSCPLRQGIPSYEHWPYPVFQVVAADFRQVDPSSDAARTCEE